MASKDERKLRTKVDDAKPRLKQALNRANVDFDGDVIDYLFDSSKYKLRFWKGEKETMKLVPQEWLDDSDRPELEWLIEQVVAKLSN